MTGAAEDRLDDPRGRFTRASLIECAEAMIAEHGVNGVSVRQIAKLSGSANSSAVAYHFGDKTSLLKAVIAHRLPIIDARRGALLEDAVRQAVTPDIRQLVAALYQPFFEQRDAGGRRSYAAFVAELVRANLVDVRTSLDEQYPATLEILNRICRQNHGLTPSATRHRIFLASALIFAAIRHIDQSAVDDADGDQQFDDAITAAAAAIRAPVGEQVGRPISSALNRDISDETD